MDIFTWGNVHSNRRQWPVNGLSQIFARNRKLNWKTKRLITNANCYSSTYIFLNDLVYTTYSISGADIAYDKVYTNDKYREWLNDIALPIAIENQQNQIQNLI